MWYFGRVFLCYELFQNVSIYSDVLDNFLEPTSITTKQKKNILYFSHLYITVNDMITWQELLGSDLNLIQDFNNRRGFRLSQRSHLRTLKNFVSEKSGKLYEKSGKHCERSGKSWIKSGKTGKFWVGSFLSCIRAWTRILKRSYKIIYRISRSCKILTFCKKM